ncbi:hypothetical protein [endosymbiont of Ridgeia piscesae]|nr:hypothetical protein [endosymbiont of Ridgeia piscesae]
MIDPLNRLAARKRKINIEKVNTLMAILIVPKVLAVYTAFHGYDKRTA